MGEGSEKLWRWFGLGRATFLVLPRVLMNEMPDEWQGRMADLLEEYEDAFPHQPDITTNVQAKQRGRFVKWPEWVLNYRHPDRRAINACRPRRDA